ncbi:hypothetical protein PPL_09171 [Heterostelium album PN500]|uniref:Uncharacterized protein n=1 Tax=Heterostelium pallidum (strain ATCC 26659 / Pp 5 / PN500) TaxID=670386 RepID=D3BKT9_HETP5|nr:hypothetical protein PPL_09171 [Heterostelium album PN500]EFA78519.1 hypothetical protein PPL_09171 [Heterostelium album PN500]|eukprot:XP_020430643.1 hypothetical protein PPL_09171 [Heterostelium album PN500]
MEFVAVSTLFVLNNTKKPTTITTCKQKIRNREFEYSTINNTDNINIQTYYSAFAYQYVTGSSISMFAQLILITNSAGLLITQIYIIYTTTNTSTL